MKPAGTKRQPKGLEFQSVYEPDMTRMVKALRAVVESHPKQDQAEQQKSEPAATGEEAG